MTLSDAVTAAIGERKRGVVLRDSKGATKRVVFLALGQLWVDRGNPSCLEPYQPSQSEATSERWRPSNDV